MGHQHPYSLPAWRAPHSSTWKSPKNANNATMQNSIGSRFRFVSFISCCFFYFTLPPFLALYASPSLASSVLCGMQVSSYVSFVLSQWNLRTAARQWWIKSIQSRNCCFIHWTITDIIRHCYYALRFFSAVQADASQCARQCVAANENEKFSERISPLMVTMVPAVFSYANELDESMGKFKQ